MFPDFNMSFDFKMLASSKSTGVALGQVLIARQERGLHEREDRRVIGDLVRDVARLRERRDRGKS
jgi:hypothetical protein